MPDYSPQEIAAAMLDEQARRETAAREAQERREQLQGAVSTTFPTVHSSGRLQVTDGGVTLRHDDLGDLSLAKTKQGWMLRVAGGRDFVVASEEQLMRQLDWLKKERERGLPRGRAERFNGAPAAWGDDGRGKPKGPTS